MSDAWKESVEYLIPIQDKERCEKYNKMWTELVGDKFTPMKSTEEHINSLIDKVFEAIEKIGDNGGWYVGDGIRVKIQVEYEPENK